MTSGKCHARQCTVNRSALTLRPNEPFRRWLQSVRPQRPGTRPNHPWLEANVYLLPEWETRDELNRIVETHCEAMFAAALSAWHDEPRDWPSDRSVARFREWFEIHVTSVVVDLAGDEPLRHDEQTAGSMD